MKYTVTIAKPAKRFLKELTDARLFRRLARAIDALSDEPRAVGSLKMSGFSDRYRIRVGNYRIVYEIHDAVLVVLVVNIDHRGDIYR